ncbi:HAMP domain-containing protein [Xanthomonas sp. CFBP 8703]|uniref:histidine kinase n=1 Tax=Xanthomonas bonasiae TaxID=2810351 RepID=A0ABS3B3U1_9XANT|nr:ATP-binding protein [Xanthomonas bonasiae]MBN6103176.1 HAMP domain-containing protein [Xanthomonas bonasiae]
MKRLRRFFASMAGRLFLILLLGMACAASFATLLANAKRRQEFDRQNMERAADRLQSFVELLQSAGPELRARLLSLGGPGIRILPATARGQAPDPVFAAVLGARGGALAPAQVSRLDMPACMPQRPDFLPPPQRRDFDRQDASLEPPTCRLIALRLDDGTPLRLGLQTQPIARQTALAVDPLFLSLLALAIALLAYVVARIASTPLQRLADAAADLGQDLQRPPLQVRGPLEVRRAAQAFNAMQQRLQRHLGERTQMLAAITHDLQTPSTRLRLRLENVQDEALRERLIGDLAAMQALIREGLELARSAETAEQRAALDLDSLLQSVVEDAAEAGADAVFEHGCGAVLPLRPLAMHRLFSNLVDNALKYGGSVRVAAERHADGTLAVYVRDRGPGIAEAELETVFAPFVRLETSRSRETGGAGLGLTIARALAEKDGATLRLRNLPEGGLEACVQWAAPLRRN